MTKILKRTLIIATIAAAALLLASGGYYLKFKHEISSFTPIETGKIDVADATKPAPNIYAIKDDFANMFIIQDGAHYIVIDCAINPTTVAAQMKKLNIAPDAVDAVFLTHTHADHVGALPLFNKARLYISKPEEQMINGQQHVFLWFNNTIPRADYTLLDDRQTIHIGNLKIEGILIPGHTTGQMAWLINDKYLFTGDILSLKTGKIAPIPALFDKSPAQAAQTRDLIRHIPTAEHIFTAHWGHTADYKTAIK